MVQDVTTKEYEVESGKMSELVVFARSMQKSCAILTNQVSSLNILVVSFLFSLFLMSLNFFPANLSFLIYFTVYHYYYLDMFHIRFLKK